LTKKAIGFQPYCTGTKEPIIQVLPYIDCVTAWVLRNAAPHFSILIMSQGQRVWTEQCLTF